MTTATPADQPTEGTPQNGHPRPKPDEGELKSVLESLIFVANKPVTERKLARAARSTLADVRPVLAKLVDEYADRGIRLQHVAGGYQFRSADDNAEFVKTFVAPKPIRLTRAQLETLAIIAYRQPITRPEVDDVRGVDSGSALGTLAERGLIKILGRKDEPGRPLLYGTTPRFLEFFGLGRLADLPTLQEFSELTEEHRALYERRMGEPIDIASAVHEAELAEAQAQQQLLEEEHAAQYDDDEEWEDDEDDEDDDE